MIAWREQFGVLASLVRSGVRSLLVYEVVIIGRTLSFTFSGSTRCESGLVWPQVVGLKPYVILPKVGRATNYRMPDSYTKKEKNNNKKINHFNSQRTLKIIAREVVRACFRTMVHGYSITTTLIIFSANVQFKSMHYR